MGLITPAVHRVLDFVTVVAFALAPTLFHLSGRTAALAYGLAVVHLLITLATHFPGRGRYPVPFRAHGIVELLVGLALVAVPLVRHWTHGARIFYPAMGVAILLVWALSRYGEPTPVATRATTA
jgi:hypothetical protein